MNFKMTVKMKTRFTLIALAVIAASVSCQKDSSVKETIPQGEYKYEFGIVSEQPGVRSILDGTTIKWEAGDEVGVFAGSNSNSVAQVASDLSTLALSLSSPLSAGDVVYAYYPRSASSSSASNVTVEIATAQTVTGGVFDADAMPVAIKPLSVTAEIASGASTATLEFYNLASVVRFHIYSTDPAKSGSVKSVKFEANTELAGSAGFDITGDPETGTLASPSADYVTTTLDVAATVGSTRETTAALVPMVIAPGTYKGKITITMDDATVYTYDIVNPFSIERSALKPVGVDLARANSGAIEGSGTEADPYIVHNQTELATALSGSNHVKLGSNILLSDWTSVDFGGVFDGDGNTISGLTQCLVNALTGTVKNVKFTEVAISNYKSSDNCKGVVAQTAANATVTGVAAYGELASSTTNGSSDYSGVGGVVGRASGATVISNCYIDVDIPVAGSNYSVGGILGIIRETDNIVISNCTYAGTISGSGNYTKFGGILGRKTNVNQTSNDIIQDCLVSGSITVSGTGSNMLGGLFGALQGSTVSGDYVGGITIVRSAFTGSISAGAAVGGIAGVGPSIVDCFVSGNVQATTTGSNGGSAGVVAAAKGKVNRCVVAGSRISGTNQANFSTAGIVCQRNGNTPDVTRCATINAILQDDGKTILGATSNLTASDNYWYGVTYINNGAYVTGSTVQDGDAFASAPTQANFESLGYDFTNVWKWNSAGYPELKNAGCPDSVK